MLPLVSVSVVPTAMLPARVIPPLPFRITLPACIAATFWFNDPRKATVPEVAVNVPLFIKSPYRFRVPPAFTVTVAPPLMVRLCADAVPVITGLLGVPALIATSVVVPGIPPHQLPAVFQSGLTSPVQVWFAFTVKVAAVLATMPQGLLITTSYWPASVATT